MNGVRMSGSTCDELESDAGPDTDRLVGFPSGNQTMSPAVFGDISNPTIPVPSGAMKNGLWKFGPYVRRSTVPLPSAACANRLDTPAAPVRDELYTIR